MLDNVNYSDPLITTERVVFCLLAPEPSATAQGDADLVRVRCGVEIPTGQPLNTGAYPGIAARALALYPHMARHRCENGHPLGVREEFIDTEIAHLFEHLLIEEFALSGVARSQLSGETLWNFESTGWGRYTVRVNGVPATVDCAEVALRAARSVGVLLGM